MNFKRLSLVAVQAIGLGLLPTAAFGATDTTFFQGTVPGSCTITGATTSSSPASLTYSTDAGGTLSGETTTIGINCNVEVNATLSGVVQSGNPTETSNTAILKNASGADVITSTVSTSAATAIGNANGSTSNYTVSLAATGASVPGTYNFSVVLTTLE